MNRGMIRAVLGKLIVLVALTIVPSFLVALYYQEQSSKAFLLTILIAVIVGGVMSLIPAKSNKIRIQDGFAIVTFGWILASAFGALPFYLSGTIASYTDAFFETMSGFTTTGATILTNVEALDNGMLFWRSFTHWLGGMGILVVAVAILPTMGSGGFQIFKAESPGPVAERIVPKIKDTARILYTTYAIITLAEFILLIIGGMPPLDSAIHTFGSVGTGGFSSKQNSIGYYDSNYIKIVITFFMVMCGGNISLYYSLFKHKFKKVFHNSELRLYLAIVTVSSLLIAANLMFATRDYSLGDSLVDGFFQVGSIITTTGYSSTNFDAWPAFSKGILFLMMFIGGCAGSTAGSIKVIRIMVVLKQIRIELHKIFHPKAVVSLKVDDKVVNSAMFTTIASHVILYIAVFVLATLAVSIEGHDLITNSSAVAATLGNIGPGFALVGPVGNFNFYSDASTWLFSLLMLMGRLELFTVLALFSPKLWKRDF